MSYTSTLGIETIIITNVGVIRMLTRVVSYYMLVILAALIIGGFLTTPMFYSHVDTKYDKARGDIDILSEALDSYKKENGAFPSNKEGLNALVNYQGKGYLDRLPKDPWGKAYYYQYPGVHNKNSFDLWSYGKDDKPGGKGVNLDIPNWKLNN